MTTIMTATVLAVVHDGNAGRGGLDISGSSFHAVVFADVSWDESEPHIHANKTTCVGVKRRRNLNMDGKKNHSKLVFVCDLSVTKG